VGGGEVEDVGQQLPGYHALGEEVKGQAGWDCHHLGREGGREKREGERKEGGDDG